jgi:hypothetical protein
MNLRSGLDQTIVVMTLSTYKALPSVTVSTCVYGGKFFFQIFETVFFSNF